MGLDVKITTISRILDVIAPFSCRGCGRLGELLCGCCKKYIIQGIPKICPRCRKTRKKCSCSVPCYVAAFREGVMEQLTEDYKYKSIRKTAELLAELLDSAIPQKKDDDSKVNFGDRHVVVVPLPTITRHIRERGFDHAYLLAKKLAKRRGWITRQILIRQNKTVQVGADEKTRRMQVKDAYGINNKYRELDDDVLYLLVDDVWTTGASMEAAIHAMKKAGAVKIATAVLLMPRD